MHLIDNIKLKFKFGMIWSDSAHDPPGKPGTSTAKHYSAGSLHMKSFITKRVKPITNFPIVFSTFRQLHRLKQTSFQLSCPYNITKLYSYNVAQKICTLLITSD